MDGETTLMVVLETMEVLEALPLVEDSLQEPVVLELAVDLDN